MRSEILFENSECLDPIELNNQLLKIYKTIPPLNFFIPKGLNPIFIQTDNLTFDEENQLINMKNENDVNFEVMTDEEIIYEYRIANKILNSEYRGKINDRVNNLLNSAKCTDFFKEKIKGVFYDYCYFVQKPDPLNSSERNFALLVAGIGEGKNEKGIFDYKTSRNIEQENYWLCYERNFSDKNIFSASNKLKILLPALLKEGEHISEWREEYIYHYNDEP